MAKVASFSFLSLNNIYLYVDDFPLKFWSVSNFGSLLGAAVVRVRTVTQT